MLHQSPLPFYNTSGSRPCAYTQMYLLSSYLESLLKHPLYSDIVYDNKQKLLLNTYASVFFVAKLHKHYSM